MKVEIKEMIILDKFTNGTPEVDFPKGEDFKSASLQIDFECALAIYDLSHIEYNAETKAIDAYTEASGVESLYGPQFKVLTEEANEGLKAKFRNAIETIKKFFTDMWQKFTNWIGRILKSDEKFIKEVEGKIDTYKTKSINTIYHATALTYLKDVKAKAEKSYNELSKISSASFNPGEFAAIIEDLKKSIAERGDKSVSEVIREKIDSSASEHLVEPKKLLETYKNALNTFKDFNKKTFSAAQLFLVKASGKEVASLNVSKDGKTQMENITSDIIKACKEVNAMMNALASAIVHLYTIIRSDFKKLVKEPAK